MSRYYDGTEKDMAALEELARQAWVRQKPTAFSMPVDDDLLDKAMALQEAQYQAEKLK